MKPNRALLKIRLPEALKSAAEDRAEEMGESLSVVVREALRLYLERPTAITRPSDAAPPVRGRLRSS